MTTSSNQPRRTFTQNEIAEAPAGLGFAYAKLNRLEELRDEYLEASRAPDLTMDERLVLLRKYSAFCWRVKQLRSDLIA